MQVEKSSRCGPATINAWSRMKWWELTGVEPTFCINPGLSRQSSTSWLPWARLTLSFTAAKTERMWLWNLRNLIAVRTQRVKVHEITMKNIWIHFEESGNSQKLEAVLLPEFHWNFLQEKLYEDPFWCPWHAKSDKIQSFKRDSLWNKCFYCNNKLWLCFCKEAANTIIFSRKQNFLQLSLVLDFCCYLVLQVCNII